MDLRTARKRVGMSQEALAKKIGVSQPIIHHIETGQTFPSVFQQMQIEKALNVSIDWEDHINAPLTGREKLMLNRLYEIGIQKMDEKEWDEVIKVNLKGTFLCAQRVGRKMIEQKKGKIINISSINIANRN